MADGTPIEGDKTYSVTVNSFLLIGGDGFLEFAKGTNFVNGIVDLDALVYYVKKQASPITVSTGDRIKKSNKQVFKSSSSLVQYKESNLLKK
jgi:5'-nucleotidase